MKRVWIFTVLILAVVLSLAGCGQREKNKEEKLVTVDLWHVYGGQADSPLNDLIEQFNETAGKDAGVQVRVTSVTNTNTIHENVLDSANKEPGAPTLPNMFVSYPKTVLAMQDSDVLVDYNDYFSEEELEAFIPEFVEEGMIEDRLFVLPVAKSTEVLFVNKTAFERFTKETGATLEDLNTWEGLYRTAELYYDWTDQKTPEIEEDGKTFFVHDYHFNYFQVGVESLGENFFKEDTIAFGNEFEKVWAPYAKAAIKGGVWLQSGYATEPLRTGDAIVSVASSASVLYYSNTVTYADNTTEEIEIITKPCPVFEQGEKLVMQRGAGICTVKTTKEEEEACITFLKWLTEPDNNIEFVTSLGYMPVKKEAFGEPLEQAIEGLDNPMYSSLYEGVMETQEEYRFYTPPKLDTYLELETTFEEQVRKILDVARGEYIEDHEKLDALTDRTCAELKGIYE